MRAGTCLRVGFILTGVVTLGGGCSHSPPRVDCDRHLEAINAARPVVAVQSPHRETDPQP